MFNKLVAIEPVILNEKTRGQLKGYAKECIFYNTMPQNDGEIIARIADADAVLVSFTTQVSGEVLRACPNLQYVGMCCSLYSPDSANVDIGVAEELGIAVKGVRDYGDEGVPEYVVSELVRFLHGFGGRMWREEPTELTGIKVGILGMGTTGQYIARALRFFGAEVFYYSRTRKHDLEGECGYQYLPLEELLAKAEIVCTCLNRNAILLGEGQFELLGNGKILVNISIGPGHDVKALENWLDKGNYVFSDTVAGIDPAGVVSQHPNVFCVGQSAGKSIQAYQRLGDKVLQNIDSFWLEQKEE